MGYSWRLSSFSPYSDWAEFRRIGTGLSGVGNGSPTNTPTNRGRKSAYVPEQAWTLTGRLAAP